MNFARPNMVNDAAAARFARAIAAAEKCLIGFDAMTDDPAPAVSTHRRQFMDGAFETVEYMGISCRDYFKRKIIIVSADFASCHLKSPPLVWHLYTEQFGIL